MPNKGTTPIGERFGRLTVLAKDPERSPSGKVKLICRCECGVVKSVIGAQLRSGKTASCGCFSRDSASARMTTHGASRRGVPEYVIWKGIRSRCSGKVSGDPGGYYSQRGITLCQRWQSFENFYEDMGSRPSPSHSIDRIDNLRGYEPDNCRWSDAKTQSENRRHVTWFSHDGKTLTLTGWADILGTTRSTLEGRLKRGWSIERAFSQPIRYMKGQ